MYRFKDFLLIEKVSNKEIKSILNDPNIMVGIEFEMILDDLEEVQNKSTEYGDAESLDSDYNEYRRKIIAYVQEVKDEHTNWKQEIKDEANTYKKELKIEAKKFEDEIVHLEGLVNNFATTNTDDIQDKIDTANDELYSVNDIIDDLDGYLIRMEYQELQEFLVENDREAQELFEYVNDNMSRPPEPSDDLEGFCNNYIGQYIDSTQIEWYEVFSDPEYYDSRHVWNELNIVRPSDYLEDWESDESNVTAFEDYPYWDDLPFSNYDIGEYHSGSSDSPDWRIESDESLSSGGVEIISPVMPIQKMMKILPKMFDFIKKHGSTDRSTGLHVNLSYKGKKFETEADMLKLMLFVDEGFVWKNFPERVGNHYTASVLDKVIKDIKQNRETISSDFDKIEKKTLALFKKNIKGPDAKFFGVNTSNSGGENGRIEFRYLGGSGYEKKLKEITSAIGRFGFYMSVALNDKLRKKEYILKLNRLHNKFASKEEKNEVTPAEYVEILSRGKNAGKYWIYKRNKYVVKQLKNGEKTMIRI